LESAKNSGFGYPDVFLLSSWTARNCNPQCDTKSVHRSSRLPTPSVMVQSPISTLLQGLRGSGCICSTRRRSNCECACPFNTSASALDIVAVSKIGFTSASNCPVRLRHATDEDCCEVERDVV